jgi:hypothetical protein
VARSLLDKEKLVETIKRVPGRSFTVLEFMDVFQSLYPLDWQRLVQRYGLYGEKRRYTVTTYLSNRLDLYSKEPDSLLLPLTSYSEDRSKDYRRPTKEERKRFGSPWIAVFKKREAPETWETAGNEQVRTASAAS